MPLQRQALSEELLWLALFAAAVGVALVAGAEPTIAIAVGLTAYLLWHLVQAVRLLLFVQRNSGLKVPWIWGVWRDAFDRVRWMQRREQKRKRRQRRFFARFRKMVAAMPDGVIILGSSGEVSWVNPQARLYFGLGDGALEGRRLVDLVDEPLLLDYLEAGDFERVLELEAPGDPAVMLSISVSRFKKGRQRFLLVARDITRQHYLHQSQRDFSLNVSHELRTPLTVVRGYLETLCDSESPESPRRKPLLRMLQQAERMQDVIQDLLMLSRLESRSEAVGRKPVVVADLLDEVAHEAERLAKESKHVLAFAGDPTLLFLGDESLLRCAFSNLIFNAIRHTPMRTRVDVTWGSDGDYAFLEVRDNGTGIPTRHLPRLTERFYRVDAGRSRDAGGTGLGLAIVSQILDTHDASLLIRSEEGRGARFSCRFPRQRWSRLPVESGDLKGAMLPLRSSAAPGAKLPV
ncbi:MAG: phosphate regulon sensor histidine kinase PhoR [Sedimenticolaceae bacterium]